jgi:hypothetical protein
MKKYTLYFIVIAFCFAILFYANKKATKWINTPEIREKVPNTESLPDYLKECIPAAATHISYCKRLFLCTTYEYNIPENDFLAWAQTQNIPMMPIKEPAFISRYYYLFVSRPTMDDPNEQNEDEYEHKLNKYESLRSVTVKNGYEYHHVLDDGGGSHIVYDSDAQKAYHDYPHR